MLTNTLLSKNYSSAIRLCTITALFFVCTGCESPQTPPKKRETPPYVSSSAAPSRAPLPLLNDDPEDLALADESPTTQNAEDMSVIQFLNMQKKTQTKRIEALKNDLEETRARLDNIKNDIMIKGSTKEKQFNEKMAHLEERVKESSARIADLEQALSERNNALEEKRQELENLSITFSKNNNSLSKDLEQKKNELAQQREENEKIRSDAAQVESQLKETNNIINQLQNDLNSTHSRLEEETGRSRELQAALEKTQEQYQLVMAEHSALQTQIQQEAQKANAFAAMLENTKRDYQVLLGQHPQFEARIQDSEYTIQNLETDLKEIYTHLSQEKNRSSELATTAEKIQQQYRGLKQENALLQARLDETAQKNIELMNGQQMFSKSKETLEANLLAIIKDLEGQLADNMKKSAELTSTQYQLAHTKTSSESEYLATIESLKESLAREQHHSSELKQMVARQSQNNKELAMNFNEKQPKKQQEMADLQKRLSESEAYARALEASLEQVSENGISALQMHQLDKEIEVHKESLISAQLELLELSEDYAQLDEKYGSAQKEMSKQIALLEEKNTQLAKNLQEAEQRLVRIQQSKTDTTAVASSEQYKRMNTTLDHVTMSLEREKAKRQAIENELVELQNKYELSKKSMPSIALAESNEEELQANLQEALKKYEDVQLENKKLQKQLESTALWASNLQNEVSAYETSTGNTATFYHQANGGGDNTPAKLKAKIAYLTTRLAQEKDRAQEAMEKLQEAQKRLRDLQ